MAEPQRSTHPRRRLERMRQFIICGSYFRGDMKALRFIIFLIVCPILGLAQTAGHYVDRAQTPSGQGISHPIIRVCLEPAVGSPCSTAGVSIFSDPGMTPTL